MYDSIPICRSILKHWVYQDAEYLKVWLTMLSRARYIDEPKAVMYEKSLCTLNYGQFIFGRKAWSKQTGVSERRLRGLLTKLMTDNMLILKTKTNHFSVYEITNYAKFNHQSALVPQGLQGFSDQQMTSRRPADDQQMTTNEEGTKKEKKVKDSLDGYFESLWKLYPKKEGKGQVSKAQKQKLLNIGNDEMTRAISRYIKAKEGKDKQYLQNGSTFFNSGYVDYLDANYKEDKPTREGRVEWR